MCKLLKSKRGFFMPTVVIYLIFMFSFIIYQVYQVVDYKQVIYSQKNRLQLEYIKKQAIKLVKDDLKKQEPYLCLIPTIYMHKTFAGHSVDIKRNCIRQQPPPEKAAIIPEAKQMTPLYRLLFTGPNDITRINFDSKRGFVVALASMQINKEWIGIPVDLESVEPTEWPKLIAIRNLPFYEIYTIDIKYNDTNYAMMLIGDVENDKITHVFFT